MNVNEKVCVCVCVSQRERERMWVKSSKPMESTGCVPVCHVPRVSRVEKKKTSRPCAVSSVNTILIV